MSNEPIIDLLDENKQPLGSNPDTDDIQVINRDPFDLNLEQSYNFENDTKRDSNHTGFTPILQSLDEPIDEVDNHQNLLDNQLITQPKMYSNLPPMSPLTDSVIPNGLSFQPFNEDNNTSQPPYNNQALLTNSQQRRRKEAAKTRPVFLKKIWSMVNDPSNSEYIKWDEDGKSFQVFHREDFMKNILPKYFKHNQFSSFVRQLNMYGWHKVQDINSGTLKDDNIAEENWKFENPFFQRGREDLLDNIVRNKSIAQDDMGDKQINLKLVLGELDNIKLNQMALSEDLRRIRKDNKTLWQENFIARDRHIKQSQTLDKILKFLATVYGNNNTGKILEVEEETPNINLDTINDDAFFEELSNTNNTRSSTSTRSGTGSGDNGVGSSSKPRLMLMNQAYKSSHTTPNEEASLTASPVVNESELINGLEQNIYHQGQSIQQVQDWIQKLSTQQQLQQQQILSQQQQLDRHNDEGVPLTPGKLDLDFDVNDFLRSEGNTPGGNSVGGTPVPDEEPRRKKAKTSKFEELEE